MKRKYFIDVLKMTSSTLLVIGTVLLTCFFVGSSTLLPEHTVEQSVDISSRSERLIDSPNQQQSLSDKYEKTKSKAQVKEYKLKEEVNVDDIKSTNKSMNSETFKSKSRVEKYEQKEKNDGDDIKSTTKPIESVTSPSINPKMKPTELLPKQEILEKNVPEKNILPKSFKKFISGYKAWNEELDQENVKNLEPRAERNNNSDSSLKSDISSLQLKDSGEHDGGGEEVSLEDDVVKRLEGIKEHNASKTENSKRQAKYFWSQEVTTEPPQEQGFWQMLDVMGLFSDKQKEKDKEKQKKMKDSGMSLMFQETKMGHPCDLVPGDYHLWSKMAKPVTAIVIGGGAAGLAAMRTLSSAGLEDAILLEAQDRLGGRISTIRQDSWMVDEGASAIEGELDNTVFELAREMNLETSKIVDDDHLRFAVTSEGGQVDAPNVYKGFKILKSIKDEIKLGGLRGYHGKSVGHHFMERFETMWGKDDSEMAMSWMFYMYQELIRSQYSADLWNVSARDVDNFKHKGKKYTMSQGFDMVIKYLMESITPSNIKTSSPVCQIYWDNPHREDAMVVTSSGESYFASYVISTIPVNPLKKRLRSMFFPSLPYRMTSSLAGIEQGLMNKIFMGWNIPWWGDVKSPHTLKPLDLNIFWTDYSMPAEMNWLSSVVKIQSTPENPNILEMAVNEEGSREMEVLGTDEIITHVMHFMKKITKQDMNLPDFFHRSRWGQNQWVQGSYKSYITMKGEAMGISDRMTFAPILKNSKDHQNLYFSGEMTSNDRYGTVDGAIITGVESAQQILLDIHLRAVFLRRKKNRKAIIKKRGHLPGLKISEENIIPLVQTDVKLLTFFDFLGVSRDVTNVTIDDINLYLASKMNYIPSRTERLNAKRLSKSKEKKRNKRRRKKPTKKRNSREEMEEPIEVPIPDMNDLDETNIEKTIRGIERFLNEYQTVLQSYYSFLHNHTRVPNPMFATENSSPIDSIDPSMRSPTSRLKLVEGFSALDSTNFISNLTKLHNTYIPHMEGDIFAKHSNIKSEFTDKLEILQDNILQIMQENLVSHDLALELMDEITKIDNLSKKLKYGSIGDQKI